MGTFNIDAIDISALEKFRKHADPIADKTVDRIIELGDQKLVNSVMAAMFSNASFQPGMFQSLGPELSNTIDEYIETTGRLPHWAHPDKIKAGEEVFACFGPEVFMLLNVSSLPMCYTCAKGAQVLYATGRLLTHNQSVDPLARRLMETAQMVVNVLSEGGLSASGKGIITIQKVRLIHAAIRHYLKQGQNKGKVWDVQQLGEPINQEDLAGTLMSFSPVILTGLKKLKLPLSQKQVEGYTHAWKVVGYLMGIEEPLLPDTYEEGLELATKILSHQADQSEAGEALTGSCVQFMQHIIPGNIFNDVPNYFISYFLQDFSARCGKDLASCIGIAVRDEDMDRSIMRLTRLFVGETGKMEDDKALMMIAKNFNMKLLEGIIHHYNHGKSVEFFIPPSLKENWGLIDPWENKITTPAIFGNRLAWQQKHNNK